MSTISSEYTGRDELNEQYRALQATKDEILKTNETEIDQLKKKYSVQKADLDDRFERSLQNDKINHYDQLRQTKAQLNREQMQLETAGRQHLSQKMTENTKAEVLAQREGESKVNEIKQKYVSAEESERERMLAAQAEIRGTHQQNARQILADSERKIGALREQKEKILEDAQSTHAVAIHQIGEHYDHLRTGVQTQYQTGLESLYKRTNDELSQKQQMLTQQIQTYQRRAEDPFYRMKRYDSSIQESGEEYVIRVRVPDYERNQFRVQVAGQEVQLTGIRTNQERTEVEPGRWVSTDSHQTVSERYPLDTPVDGRKMTMVEDGEWLEYHLPKYTRQHRLGDLASSATGIDPVEAALIREIEFPKSLPRPAMTKKDSGNTFGA